MFGKPRRKTCIRCNKEKEDSRKDYCNRCETLLFDDFLGKLKEKI